MSENIFRELFSPDPAIPVVSTDNQIIERSRAEPAAFAELYDRHYRLVHRYAARRTNAEVADDVMSETFLVAFEQRSRFDTARGEVKSWLLGIATTLLKKHWRLEAREWRSFTASDAAALTENRDFTADAEARVDAGARMRRLGWAVASLSNGDRDALLERAARARGAKSGSARPTADRAKLRRGLGWGLVGLSGVAVVSGALVLSNLTTVNGGDQIGQAPVVASESPASGSATGEARTAESVLRDAANKARQVEDPVLAEGQYLLLETEIETSAWEGATDVNPEVSPVAWMIGRTVQLYVAWDDNQESIAVNGLESVSETLGPESEAAAARWLQEQPTEVDPATMVWRFKNSEVMIGKVAGTQAAYAALPRDPQALFDYYVADLDASSPQYDAECLRALQTQLRDGATPADVRASLYEAMLLIPSLTLVDAPVEVNGVAATALSVDDTVFPIREQVLIDQTTGALVGMQTVYTMASNGLPAGHVKDSAFYTAEVVDGVPF